jgi:hypothetical protein
MPARDPLPEVEVAKLRDLRSTDTKQFRARVRDLRDCGWTLAAISEPFDTGRSTARAWELAAPAPAEVKPAKDVPTSPARLRSEKGATRVRKLRADIPASERAEFKRLAESARGIRGWTPPGSQTRKDAEKFETLLEEYVARGVPVKRLARHAGVTYRAIAARLERRAERQSSALEVSDVA